ncbi:UDP-glucose 4-epimerase family protein [Chitinolyticbacter meiyuanensis]|uniref:UDP-glucose 4-epimerase family protein n=1 Tax=Chitinolyticbacter meiyuanensis TaxID=682798 RepID=UPI0011E5B230|nr:SDR family oxidoreductase [Chitinolyticbacter meiyuanensis]
MILVTGASGFVGSRLCERLVQDGVAVRPVVRQARVGAYQVKSLDADTDWSGALSDVTEVVHAAARVHVMDEVALDPLAEFRKVNVEGTLHLARQAAVAGVKRFVFISSIKVNGEQTAPGHPFRADDAPAPMDPYGVSKNEAEQGLLAFAHETGMEVVIIRPPLVYGPGVKANFAKMMATLARGVPLPFGLVDNRRSLVALDNLVDLITVCLRHPAAANQIFLAGDGEDLSTAQLLRRLADALGRPARLLPVPIGLMSGVARLLGKKAFTQRLFGSLQVDIEKNRQCLGWVPPVSVDDGLRRAAAHFQGLRQ